MATKKNRLGAEATPRSRATRSNVRGSAASSSVANPIVIHRNEYLARSWRRRTSRRMKITMAMVTKATKTCARGVTGAPSFVGRASGCPLPRRGPNPASSPRLGPQPQRAPS